VLKKSEMLISFLAISTVISAISYMPHRMGKTLYLAQRSALEEQVASGGFANGMLAIITEPISFLALFFLILFSFNLFPLILFFIRE